MAHLELRGFRNLVDTEVPLAPGVTMIHGPNGAGKTNLLEALYFGLAGRSFRASRDREAICFGAEIARVGVELVDDSSVSGDRSGEDSSLRPGEPSRTFLASISRTGERRLLVAGNQLAPAEAAAHRPPLAVFTPDRLGLVKGPPAIRRTHLDRFVVALWPGRSEIRVRYARALTQRNALLGRVRAGLVEAAALDGWDQELATQGVALRGVRNEAVELIAEPFADAAYALGLGGDATIRYTERGAVGDVQELAGALNERRDGDLRRGFTGLGPHADELGLEVGGRALRRYGSQGQQRIAVLSLLLAEREALVELGRPTPLTLLDDVMSELDLTRRRRLAERLQGEGQVLITTTDPNSVPDVEGERIAVRSGRIDPPEHAGGPGRRPSGAAGAPGARADLAMSAFGTRA